MQININPTPKVYILHENEAWIEPLRAELEEREIPYETWFISEGAVDLAATPPVGVFYNRMSASSHTRDHRYAVELTEPIVAWLEAHGRRVVNDRHALMLEVRKFEQYLALNQQGIRTPRTIAATGRKALLEAAAQFQPPFIYKPNRGGKGLGVMKFNSLDSFQAALVENDLESIDGIGLIQEYIAPADGSIVRSEFVGGQFLYSVRVDASEGFELCPADACQIDDAFCPAEADEERPAKFQILEDPANPDLPAYTRFLADNGFEVAAIEYITATDGKRYVYDVNMNTNYNSEAELKAGIKGMGAIADFLDQELALITGSRKATGTDG
jgi:hypothetical protein